MAGARASFRGESIKTRGLIKCVIVVVVLSAVVVVLTGVGAALVVVVLGPSVLDIGSNHALP